MLPCRNNPQHEQYEGATDWHNTRGEPVALRLEPDRDDPKLPMAPAARAARQRIDADPDEWQKRLTVFLGDTLARDAQTGATDAAAAMRSFVLEQLYIAADGRVDAIGRSRLTTCDVRHIIRTDAGGTPHDAAYYGALIPHDPHMATDDENDDDGGSNTPHRFDNTESRMVTGWVLIFSPALFMALVTQLEHMDDFALIIPLLTAILPIIGLFLLPVPWYIKLLYFIVLFIPVAWCVFILGWGALLVTGGGY